MTDITWDGPGEKRYETGIDHCVLFVVSGGSYGKGVAWNGLTSVTESPEGAEASDFYADNQKYASLRSAENFKATLNAYTFPQEFMACDGYAEIAKGAYVGGQERATFGLYYRSKIGTDQSAEAGFRHNFVYGLTASPSEKARNTINDSPELVEFSWEVSSNPVSASIGGRTRSVSILTVDSTVADAGKLETLIAQVVKGTLPMPDAVAAALTGE